MRTYAGIPKEFADRSTATFAIVPCPYDGTSTWLKGADKGPDAMLNASENMELYDIPTRSEVYRKGIWLSPPVLEATSPEAMVGAIHSTVKELVDEGKFVITIGGEHSISIGCIRAFRERYKDLTVLQIDAHADLRPEYMGSKCNHACALFEASQNCNLIQVGIRSMDAGEEDHMDRDKVFFAHDIQERATWQDEVLDLLTDNVYITIDLDGFDPSIVPATGTPEPGGLSWYQVISLIEKVMSRSNVQGADIMELCPMPGQQASEFLAAKLLYRLLSLKNVNNQHHG